MPRAEPKTDLPPSRPTKTAGKAKLKSAARLDPGPMHSGLQMSKLASIPLPRAPVPMARRFTQIATAIWAEACAGESLSHPEFAVLGCLGREPGLDQINLAARVGVDRTNIGLIIDGLEKSGFVERSVNPKDRRARLMRVTPAGQQAHTSQTRQVAVAREKILGPLTAAERETLYDLLERIIAANEQYSIPGAGRRKRSG